MSDVYALVRSIREQRFSRNQHFEEHATSAGMAARRLHRFLSGIERDVLSASQVQLKKVDGTFSLSMEFPEVRLTRLVSLTPEEYAFLVEDPLVAARLG